MGTQSTWGQCKCRSSDHSKEPGWHHEQPSWHPHQQQKRAQQLGVDWGHPSFLFSSFLFAKLFPSQQRAKTGWQGLLVFWMPLPLVVLSIHRSSTSAWIAGEAARMRVYRPQPPAWVHCHSFARRMRLKMVWLVHFFVLSLTGRCRTWCDGVAPPPASLVAASPLDPDSPWAPAWVLQAWELPSMQQQQICLLDWALQLSQGKTGHWSRCGPIHQLGGNNGPLRP